MRAAQIDEYGDASAVKIKDIEKPAASEGKVLVEVHASSINPYDISVRSGAVQKMVPLQLPVTLGGDIAGVVAEVGEGVTHVAVGDKVYGQAGVIGGNSGAFAEFASTKADQVAKAPSNLDFLQAASLPLVGVSAVQALCDHIKLTEGQKILIIGGSGGIGTIAIQLAKHLGAHVTATATGDSIAVVKELGADEVVDYISQDISELPADFDAIYNTVRGDTVNKALSVLKPGGIALSITGLPDQEITKKLGVRVEAQITKVTSEALDSLREYVEAGAIKAQVDKVYGLDEISEAFGAKENGSVTGKIVIKIS